MLMKDFMLKIFNCWIKKNKSRPWTCWKHDTWELEMFALVHPWAGKGWHFSLIWSLLLPVKGLHSSVCDNMTCSGASLHQALFIYLALEMSEGRHCMNLCKSLRSIASFFQLPVLSRMCSWSWAEPSRGKPYWNPLSSLGVNLLLWLYWLR